MNNILSRFYFFTKLLTSFTLLTIVFILIYFFYKAYSNQNNAIEMEKAFKLLREDYLKNQELQKSNDANIKTLKNEIELTNKLLNNLDNKFNKNIETLNNNNFLKEFKNLKKENIKIKKSLDLLSKNFYKIKLSDQENIQKDTEVLELIKLIKLKLEQGLQFDAEVEVLLNLQLDLNQNSNIEKLQILSTKKYIGINDLITEFDQLSSTYLENKLISQNKNYLLKYVLQLVSIKPHHHKNIEDESIRIFVEIGDQLELKNFNGIEKKILLLSNNQIFNNWLKYIKYHMEINKILSILSN